MPRKPKLSPEQAKAALSKPIIIDAKPVVKKKRAKANVAYELSLNKKFIATPELIEDIQKHYSGGATLKQIAYALGIAPDTLAKEIRDNPELSRALHKGRLDKVSGLIGKAFQMAMEGDRVMIIFLLKCIGRFSEAGPKNDAGDDVPTPPALTLNVTDPVEAMRAYERIMKET